MIKVSIIIPLYVISERFFQDLRKYENLKWSDYEILIVCDKKVEVSQKNVKVILTNKNRTGPAEKRDLGLKFSKGEICAFIDDDAYPDENWLKKGVNHFKDLKVVAVGGPGITPPEDNFMGKLGGLVYQSVFVSGGFQERFVIKENLRNKRLNDWPAYNLLVRTSILKKVGGYGNSFYGGEDTFLCLKLIKEGEIVYEPNAVVFHHRRSLFKPHLKQIFNVGVHRGYFFKKYPETSRYPIYLFPSALVVLSVLFLFFSLFYLQFFQLLFFLSILYLGMIFFIYFNKTNSLGIFLISIGIYLTHVSYGMGFLKGLFTKELNF